MEHPLYSLFDLFIKMKKLLLILFGSLILSSIAHASTTIPLGKNGISEYTLYPADSLSTANIIATTTTATSSIANTEGVLAAGSFLGNDIIQKAQNAYTQLPNSGGVVTIGQATSSNPWNFSHTLSATTADKLLLIVCPGGGAPQNIANNGTGLLYTGTTGTSTSINTNAYVIGRGSGLVNCNLMGTNGTTIRADAGIELGGATGAFNSYIDGASVSGFGTGVYYGSNTSFNSIINAVVNFNGRNISEPDTTGANCENMRIGNSVIADANNQAGGATALKGMYVQESGNCQQNIYATSFDDNQIYADQFGGTANLWNFTNTHFEDPNKTAYPMFATNPNGSKIVASFIGSDMMNDVVLGQPDQIEAAGMVNLIGFTSNSNGNVTSGVTRIVNALASTTVITWDGLSCLGKNSSAYVYGNVPCSPFGVGSDFGQPIITATLATSTGIGGVAFGTSTAMYPVDIAAAGSGVPGTGDMQEWSDGAGRAFAVRLDSTNAFNYNIEHKSNGVWRFPDLTIGRGGLGVRRIGIGSTTPNSPLSLQLNDGDTGTNAFTIGSSTASATTTLANFDNIGGLFVANNLAIGAPSVNALTIAGTGSDVPNLGGSAGAASNALINIIPTADGIARWGIRLGAGTTYPLSIDYRSIAGVQKTLTTFTRNGQFGLGTSSPNALLAIHANNGDTNTTLVDVASSTAIATTSLFSIKNGGGIHMNNPVLATTTSMTIDWDAGTMQTVRLGTSATTISFANQTPGASLTLELCNPHTTGGGVTFSGVLWPGSVAPTITTTADKCDLATFKGGNGTTTPIIYGGYNQNY